MYASFFGLNEKPFSITPDPRFLFLSERHAEALAHLVYGINEAGGFIQLTGEVGTGKTTVVRSLLAQAPKHAEIALILNPRMTPAEFLLAICEELGIHVEQRSEGSLKDLVDLLSIHLLKAHADGKRIVLVVDEAQNLAPEVLEQVRLLTNLETETQKLLQIILIGQPELRELLDRTELRQLAQRITGRYHLDPLSADESAAYVRHRLRVAGATREVFANGALREINRLSGGVPRLINIICDRALLGAFTEDRHVVSASVVRRAAGEVFGKTIQPRWLPWVSVPASGLLTVASAAALLPRFLPADAAAAAARRRRASAGAEARAAAGTRSPAGAIQRGDRSGQCLQQAVCPVGYPLRGWQRGSVHPGAAVRARMPRRSAAHSRSCGCSTVPRCSTWSTRRVAPTSWCSPGSTMNTRKSTSAARSVRSASVTCRAAGLATTCCCGVPQVAVPQPLALGARSARVKWLRDSLRRVNGLPAEEPASDRFDASLVTLVEEFQRRNRLAVDGIAGVQTQVALDAALNDATTPFLREASRELTCPSSSMR